MVFFAHLSLYFHNIGCGSEKNSCKHGFLRSPFTIFVQLNEKHGVMTHTLLFLGLGMSEILFIALVVLLFFGGKKIPELMKGLGKGVKSFKDGMNGLEEDKKEEANKEDKQ